MEQNTQPSNSGVEIKLDSDGEPISPKLKKKINKKVILLIIIILLIIGASAAYFLFLNKGDDSKLPTDNNAVVLEDKKEVELDRKLDTDQDGLPDYLEKIIGTDENNSDTDGDSYSDFDEIKNGYNPLNDEKYIEEEWEVIKEKIKGENEKVYEEIIYSKINCEYKKGEYEIRAYDSSGRITGLINGEIKQEIPNSIYRQGDVVVFDPGDIGTAIKNIQYEIFSIKEGNYQFSRSAYIGGEKINFEAVNIPILVGQAHRYKFNWDILAQGKNGATLLIDNDGDGEFEKTIIADNKLMCEEFYSQIGI